MMEYVDERVTATSDDDSQNPNQMYICQEIAAAESITELEYNTPKAN